MNGLMHNAGLGHGARLHLAVSQNDAADLILVGGAEDKL